MRLGEPARLLLTAIVLLSGLAGVASVHAQDTEPQLVLRALDLENAGRNLEAAMLYRAALRSTPTPGGLLGLERVYAELGQSDSLLPALDSLIAQHPRDALYRTVQLRTLEILRRDVALRGAFESWVREAPRDVTPYREYARVLLQLGRSALADSVLQASRRALGDRRELAFETAQLRAAQGLWDPSARAWRVALGEAPYLAETAAYQLAPAVAAARDTIRAILMALPLELGARRALANLQLGWGRPLDAWDALRDLPADTASATAWAEFGERALLEERFGVAREALAASLRVRHTPELAVRAATAALRAGSPADVFTLVSSAELQADPVNRAGDYLPVQVDALAALGRAPDAQMLVDRYDRFLSPGQKGRLAQSLAAAWVRAGDLERARRALRGSGEGSDSSDASGWIALYEGRLGEARTLLKMSGHPNPELALALGIIARVRGDDGRELGAGFLALARGDTSVAAVRFVDAAAHHPEAASALLLTAARLRAGRGDTIEAIELWSRILDQFGESSESAEAELDWARTLRRRGDATAAIAHLEHLILSAPQSALLPQARRELDLVRSTSPGPR